MSHHGLKTSPALIRCCSVLSRKEVSVIGLDAHDKAWLETESRACLVCGKAFREKCSSTKKFCSKSCFVTENNKKFWTHERRERHAKIMRESAVKRRKRVHEIVGPYTKVYYKTCRHTGIGWFTSRVGAKIHPDAYKIKGDIRSYRTAASFRFSINQYPDHFKGDLIKEHGMYHPTRNPNGVSRDHMFSISDGFKMGIDPSILAHPANCQLMLHRDNHSKRSKSIISLEKLMDRIRNF